MLSTAGCNTPLTRPASPPSSMTVEQLAAAVAADARRSDLETDSKIRDQLAADAIQNAQACLQRAPQAAACLYYDGIALGLKARAHPLQAPEWPLGPGDPEAGLAAARRAAELGPDYPPNVLALAEALAKTGDTQGAVDSYRRARALIQALPPSRDRDDWQDRK